MKRINFSYILFFVIYSLSIGDTLSTATVPTVSDSANVQNVSADDSLAPVTTPTVPESTTSSASIKNEALPSAIVADISDSASDQYTIIVTATRGAQAGPLGEVPLKDIPFSVTIISGKSIENRSARILADALQTNPSAVAIQLPSTDGRGQSEVNIRGFDPFYLQNGLIMRNTLPVSVEGVERIETINGLSGFFYGFGAPGGTINFITKQPVSEAIADFSLGQYNGGVNFIHADLGGPINTGRQLTGRANAYLEDGTSFNGSSTQRRSNFSGALNLQFFRNTVLKANVSMRNLLLQGQQAAFIVDPTKVAVPSASDFDPNKLYGQPWTYVKGRQNMFGCALESKLCSIFGFRGAYSYSTVWRKNNGVSATLINNSGDYRATYSDGAPSDVYEHSAYALTDAKLNTGKIRNNITFGWIHNSFTQKNNPVSLRNILLDTFNIAHPAYVAMPDTVAPTREILQGHPVYNSLLIGDIFSYNIFSVLAGANYATYNYKNENLDTGVIKQFEQSKATPSFALTVKPIQSISVYASYMQGLATGGFTTTNYAKNVNEVLPPSVNDQYEAGVKASISKIDFTTALFRINKINEYLDPGDSVYKQDGREIHQGIEVTASGKIIDCLTLGGGGTIMDAHVEKAADIAIIDMIPANIPEKQARAYLEYAVPAMAGLSVSAGANYDGFRWVDAKNIASIPDFLIYNAGIRYQPINIKHKITFNLNVSNLLNNVYWAAYKPAGTIGLCLGAPRIISLSAKCEF